MLTINVKRYINSFMQQQKGQTMSRIRLNSEFRHKIANRMRVHLEQENTQEKEKFFKEREDFLDKQNATWQLAQQCVTRQYPKKDVDMAHYLQNKYPNVNTIAKDSCFHFGYMQKKDGFEVFSFLKEIFFFLCLLLFKVCTKSLSTFISQLLI